MREKDPFDTMLHRYRGLLFTLGRRFSHRTLEFDDLLQDATVALWKAREQLLAMPGAVQQAAMVWKVARNAMIDSLRRSRENAPLPEGFDQMADMRTLHQELHECIDRLAEPDRTIVRMQLEGYSYEEIAQEVDMTEKNVSVRLVRARERLRQAMTNENHVQP